MATMWRTAPLMWLCSALLARAAQDFPYLANVMYDICGTGSYDLTPASPCHFRLFGLALAWQECGEGHTTDFPAFQACLGGCVSKTLCTDICGSSTNATSRQCREECQVLTGCVRQALSTSTGQVSAESAARTCFRTGVHTSTPVEAPVAKLQAPPAATILAQALVRDQHPNGAAEAAEVEDLLGEGFQGSAPAQATLPVPTHRPAGGNRWLGAEGAVALEGRCSCDVSGTIRGVNTGAQGCRRHGKEPLSNEQWYCYITGESGCPGAMPSQAFPGLWWLDCASASDYYPKLFPAGCQLLEYGFSPQEQPIKIPPKPEGRGALQIATPVAPLPRFKADMQASMQRLRDFAAPLPATWHEQRGGVFLKPRLTAPQNGPPVPPSLDTPLWWELAQQNPVVAKKAPRAQRPAKSPKPFVAGFW